ncbi:hypothetical protein KC207_07855 [Phycicoccus sp. BSK3Z-2]|uniref:Uncharacterized protein n=1 Tax=Phycicoccus avicenniae TaxID=2828860 RepID=A0A941D812_9MICO|nr:hypothetical protein [Phycicoccus avicenniae]MBR7743201.1 hypothetical protein [Phycicoccus avicenniae]
MTRLGPGDLGHLLRVVTPDVLVAATRDWRRRVGEYWFWQVPDAVSVDALRERGLLLGDTSDGDELVVDPARPDTLVVLPRDADDAVVVEGGLLAAVDWVLEGNLNPWVEGWTFEAPGNVTEQRPLPGDLDGAAASLAALGAHAHVVDLGDRRTFFLPSVEGRLSLHRFEDEPLVVDVSHAESADPAEIDRLLAAVGC